jgi:hypothetical protein
VSHPGLRWDEYKLLQDKLDKIGDFKFRVKTWAASLAGLFVVGSEAIKAGWWGALCGTVTVATLFARMLVTLVEKDALIESAVGSRAIPDSVSAQRQGVGERESGMRAGANGQRGTMT